MKELNRIIDTVDLPTKNIVSEDIWLVYFEETIL